MTTFYEFWTWYRSMHRRRVTRVVHAIATGTAIALLLAAIAQGSILLALAAPLCDYGIAQLAHRLFEGNTTRPWRHPIWHLRAELMLFRATLAGE